MRAETSQGGAPRTTAVVVSYNQGRFIEQCIASLRDQTRPCRIIVIDDASPDGSGAVIRQAAAAWPEATVITHTDNAGLCARLVEGLAMVDTEYYFYLAADDWCEVDRVERHEDALDRAGPDAGLVYSDVYRADDDGNRHELTFSRRHRQIWRGPIGDAYGELLDGNWIPAPAATFRTAALRHAGGYDPTISYEDHDSFLRVAREYRVVLADGVAATHREHAGSFGRQLFDPSSTRWLRDRLLIYRKQIGVAGRHEARVQERVRALTIAYARAGGDPRVVATTAWRLVRASGRPDLKLAVRVGQAYARRLIRW